MYRILYPILFLLLLSQTQAHAQTPTPYKLTKPYVNRLNFHKGLHTLLEHEADYTTDSTNRNTYLQNLSSMYVFNGILDSAVSVMDRAGINKPLIGEQLDAATLNDCQIEDAQQYIIARATGKRVLMVNQSPYLPQHSLFVKGMLKELYSKGYRALFLETLPDTVNNLFRSDKYATLDILWPNGYYTKENCYVDLIREAARTGYTIFGYAPEAYSNLTERDSLMARNIYEAVNPEIQMVMLTSPDCNSKAKPNNFYRYVKKMYGITALTVDQTSFCEHSDTSFESPAYHMLTKQHSFSKPSVLLNTKGAINNLGIKDYDICVLFPRTTYTNSKPDWLLKLDNRKAFEVKTPKKPTIIKAYYATEKDYGESKNFHYEAPVDQLVIEKPDRKNSYQLYLPPGLFLICYFDGNGKIVKKYYQQVR